MNARSAKAHMLLLSGLLVGGSVLLTQGCSVFGDDTGTCSVTCFSRSTGNNLGTESYGNYTQKECEQALENRQTSLTQCTMEWD